MKRIAQRAGSRIVPGIVFFVLLLGATAVPVFATPAAQPQEEKIKTQTPAAAEIPAPSAAEVAAVELEQHRQEEWLSRPEGITQRAASEGAYADISATQAQGLLLEAFPGRLEALNQDPARVLSELEVEKPLGTDAALVESGEGESAIFESSVPVQSELGGHGARPVDLSLERSGGAFVPKNPLIATTLPDSAGERIHLQGGIAVELPSEDDHGAVRLGDKNLFYPETETTTDTMVSPTSGGAEVFEQLRSPQSPERFRFALKLPPGATLRPSEAGGAEIISAAGQTIEQIPPASAVDAQGADVPVTTRIEGDSLVLDVSHRVGEVAYPVLVDPNYVNDGTSFGEWVPSENSGYEYYLNNNWSSLDAISRGHYWYAPNTHGQWAFGAYGESTYIAAATFSGIYFEQNKCANNQPHGYIGLYNVSSGGYDSLHVYSTEASNATFETGWAGSYYTRDAILGVGTGESGIELGCAHELYVGGYSIQEKDPYPPSLSVSGVPTVWFGPAQATAATVHAVDTGLGVQKISMEEIGGGGTHENTPGCTGAAGSRCPREPAAWVQEPAYDSGEWTLQVSAEDPVENAAVWQQTTKYDALKPEINLEGQFAQATEEVGKKGAGNEAGENQLSLPVYNLHIEATDGSNATPHEKQSGVKNIEVFLDGAKQTVSWKAQECPASSCKMEETFQLKLLGLSAGKHNLTVDATDQVGLTRERPIEFEYIPATGMKPEYVMQRFPLPDGQGGEDEPELAVNVMNGNLVYSQQDLEVAGAGTDLEVERYYNSLLPSGQDTEWGHGWTLAQTPELEVEKPKSGPPTEALALQESGSVAGSVNLPTKSGEEKFDPEIQAVVTKEPGGYTVADESGETDDTIAFDENGTATELQPPGPADVEYSHESGALSEIAVDDPASAGGSADLAVEAAGEREPPTYASAFGSHGSGSGQLSEPCDLAVDPSGNIWLADSENNRIEEFNSKGEFVRAVGSAGTGNSQFDHPEGIATDAKGDVWVSDRGNNRIEEFNGKGEFLQKFGSKGSGNGQFYVPEGLAIDAKGDVFVADRGNSRVEELSEKGEFIRNITIGEGALKAPSDVALDSAGNLWVSDFERGQILEFSPEGAFIRAWGSAGSEPGQLSAAYRIGVGPEGDIWVPSWTLDRVQVFTPAGEYLFGFGREGSGEGQFDHPRGIGFLGSQVYVTDAGTWDIATNNRVERWEGIEAPTYVSAFGSHGSGSGQLSEPCDLAVDPSGNVWLADSENNRIVEFTPKGEFVRAVGSAGSGNSQFDHPEGIATDAKGDVWVSDRGNNRIEEFNGKGEFLQKFGSKGSGNGQFYVPEGLAVDAAGDVFVADRGNSRVEELSETGTFIRNITQAKEGEGPFDVTLDASGDLWVSYAAEGKIAEFSNAGSLIRSWGTAGSGHGELSAAYRIAIGPEGDVWTSEWTSDRVQVFSPSGEYLTAFGTAGTGEGQLEHPRGVGFFGPAVYVADAGTWDSSTDNRVERWARGEIVPPAPVEPDPSVQVAVSGGLVSSVDGEDAGKAIYSHSGELLTAVEGPEGKDAYEYNEAHRLKKVTLPNGTWAEVKYESIGRVSSVTVSTEGAKARTTTFAYSDEPRETTVAFETEPTTHYQIAPDGSVFKWWNAKVPPEIEQLTGSLYTERGEVHPGPISSGDQELNVVAHAVEGVTSIQIVANGNQLVAEKACEESKCVKLEKKLVTETENWPPGILQLEVIVTDRLGQISSERLWDNIPYTPPPNPEETTPPKFEEILHFREEFGLDLDLKGNESAIDERIFDLIAAWHDPNTPDGEVARASRERWGVPLRPVDVAEMEYRERYAEEAATLIPAWAEAHAWASYAGYYINQRQGGVIHVGFAASNQAELTTQLASELSGLAPGRITAFEGIPVYSLSALIEGSNEFLSGLSEGSAVLEGLNGLEFDIPANRVILETSNVAATNSYVTGISSPARYEVGYSERVEEESEEEPYETRTATSVVPPKRHREADGRLYGADALEGTPKPGYDGLCSTGFGGRESTGSHKPNGEAIQLKFVITAGHCFEGGSEVWRWANKGSKDVEFPIGSVARRAHSVNAGGGDETDAEAIQLRSGYVPPQWIWLESAEQLQVGSAEVPHSGETVCLSGTQTKPSCGTIVGMKLVRFAEGKYPTWVWTVKGINTTAGNSGGSVYNPYGNHALGIWTGGGRYFTPLLESVANRQGKVAGRNVGVLSAPNMGTIQLATR